MPQLQNIHTPADLRSLDGQALTGLAAEIRGVITQTAAKNGGHFASNLGMVEATIALHRVFSCPEDAIFFDVGHQAYTHKLLTGRYERFSTIRTAGGLSGFTNREESPYDTTTAGHSGSALSLAIGIAEANRLAGNERWTVAVIGDGSFTNGMVYEALNQLSAEELRLVIVLNDNEMSISKNVGGMSKYLSYIRTSEGYFTFKLVTKRVFSAIPLIGNALVAGARRVKNLIKRLTNSETWFETFGLEYIGPVNGNDIAKLERVLEEARQKKCPVIVHMKTKKGLGYRPSEEHPERWHSVGAFCMEPGSANETPHPPTFTDTVSETLLRLGGEDARICAITAAMPEGCGLLPFAERYPDRFFDVGIAEEHAAALAGGLAIGGRVPVLVLYSTFAQRVFDQLWHDVSLQRVHAVLLLSHCGLVPGDGVTHQGIYDLALLRTIPGVRIRCPDTFAALRTAIEEETKSGGGLSVIRYPKGGEAAYGGVTFDEHDGWKTAVIGASDTASDVLVTYGRIAVSCAEAIRRCGKSMRMIVLNRIVPFPEDAELAALLRQAETLFAVEEVLRQGGVGEQLAANLGRSVKIRAIEEGVLPHGDRTYLERLTGLDVDGIADFLR